MAGAKDRAGFILQPVYGPKTVARQVTPRPNLIAVESVLDALRLSQTAHAININVIVAIISTIKPCAPETFGFTIVTQNVEAASGSPFDNKPVGVLSCE